MKVATSRDNVVNQCSIKEVPTRDDFDTPLNLLAALIASYPDCLLAPSKP